MDGLMPPIDAKLILAILGPAFLALGLARWLAAGRVIPQAKAWLLVGAIFSAVATWLWWQALSSHG
jgi:hypothetical protein